MKEKLFKARFQVRPRGAEAPWACVTKEIGLFKAVLEQAGISKL